MKKRKSTKLVKSRILDILLSIVCISGAVACIFMFVQSLNDTMIKEDEEPIAVVYHKQNTAQRRFSDKNLWQNVNKSDPVYDGDRIRTGEQSEAYIIFNDETRIDLNENTLIQVFDDKGNNAIDFLNGSISVTSSEPKTENEKNIVVNTGTKTINFKNNSNAIISGKKDSKETVVAVTSGSVDLIEKPAVEESKASAAVKRVRKAVSKVVPIIPDDETPTESAKIVSKTISSGTVAVVEQPKSVSEIEVISVEKAESNAKTSSTVKRVKTQKTKTPEQQQEMIEATKNVFGETKSSEIAKGVSQAEEKVKKNIAPEVKKIVEEERQKEEQIKQAKIDAERKAEEERLAKIEAERKAKAEAERKAEQERQAKLAAEKKAKEEEAARKAEQERLAKIEAERKAKAEAERKAEQERQAKLAAEKKAKEEEAARKAEQERLAKLEAEQKAKEEATQKAEQERLAKLAAEQKAKEEAAKKAEQERLARLEAQKKLEEVRKAKVAAEKAKEDDNDKGIVAPLPTGKAASSVASAATSAAGATAAATASAAKNVATPKAESSKSASNTAENKSAEKTATTSSVKITKLKPVLKSPANNFVVTEDILIEDDAIVFKWGKMQDASKYKITIRENSSSGKKVFEKTVKSNSFKLSDDDLACLDNGTYYWSVVGQQTVDGKTYTSHAAAQSFSVHIDEIGTATIDKSTLLH